MEASLGCSKCRYAKNGCARCRDPGFQARQRAREAGQSDASKSHAAPAARRSRGKRKVSGRQEAHTEAAPPEKKPRNFQRSSSSSDRRRAGAAQAAAEHAKNTDVPHASGVQPEQQGGARGRRGEAVGAEPPEQIASGMEMGLAAGLLALPVAALEAGSLGTGIRKDSAQGAPAGGEEGGMQPAETSQRQEHSAGGSRGSQGSAGSGGSPSEEQRRASFLEMLHSNMQRRQQAKAEACGAVTGPSLATALAKGARKAVQKKQQQGTGGDPRVSLWEPPQSPYGLIEEQLFGDPWRLLVACILLNKTSIVQVRKVIWKLFQLMPTPEAAVAADLDTIRTLIEPLGLAPKRAPMLQRFSREYVEKQWRDPEELHGIGQYGADAYRIFCRGDWRAVSPKDKDLLRYHQWLLETEGLGTGLTREPAPVLDGSEEA